MFEYAKFLIDNLEPKEAVSILYRILTIEKDNDSAKMLLFKALLEINEYEDALKTGNELLLNNPKDITLLVNYVDICNKLEDYENELIYLNKILQLEPSNISAITKKASALLELNYVSEAIIVYNKLYSLGFKDDLIYSYTGIQKAINSEYKLSIELLNLGLKENIKFNVHYFRAVLYLTYCLCETKVSISNIEFWFKKINFKILAENYFSSDENIAAKTVYSIVKLKLDAISEFSNTDYLIRECINTCLNKTESYFTEKSNSIIAECWYEIALKQCGENLFCDALVSCKKAINYMPNENRFSDIAEKIEKNIEVNENKRKLKKTSIIGAIVVVIIVVIFSVIKYKNLAENKAWKLAETTNKISSYNDYLTKYPDGKFKYLADSLIENLSWKEALNSNTFESYSSYLNIFKNRKNSIKADSLRQELLWKKALIAKTDIAFDDYINKFPSGKHINEANKYLNLYSINVGHLSDSDLPNEWGYESPHYCLENENENNKNYIFCSGFDPEDYIENADGSRSLTKTIGFININNTIQKLELTTENKNLAVFENDYFNIRIITDPNLTELGYESAMVHSVIKIFKRKGGAKISFKIKGWWGA